MRWHAPVLFLAPKNSESSAARQQKIHIGLELPNYKKGNSAQHKSDVGLLKKHTRHNDCDLYRQRHCVRYPYRERERKMADLRHAVAAAVLLSSECLHAAAIDGYLRVPAVYQSQSGGAASFKLPGAETKYRLGNECEIYGELQLTEGVTTLQDGAALKGYAMGTWYQPSSRNNVFWDKRGDSALVQAYAAREKIAALRGANVWLGRRYYKREDIHITDFYYWNPTGLGAGIEDIGIGSGNIKLSYAVLREDSRDQPQFAARHDVQLRGKHVNANGDLEVGLSVIPPRAAAEGGAAGWSVTVQPRQSKIAGDGWNKLALQYGVGPGTGLGATGALTNTSDVTRLRVCVGGYAQLTPAGGGMLTAVYQRDASDKADQVWTSAGGRLTYTFTEHIKLHAELGQDRVHSADADTPHAYQIDHRARGRRRPQLLVTARTATVLHLRALERRRTRSGGQCQRPQRHLDFVERHFRRQKPCLDHRREL